MARFVKINEDQKNNLLMESKSENSLKKAKWAVNVFKEWLNYRRNEGIIQGLHVFKDFEEMTKSELNSQLEYFVLKTAATCLKNSTDTQRRAVTGNRSASLAVYETATDTDVVQTSKTLYSCGEPSSPRKYVETSVQSKQFSISKVLHHTNE